MNGMRVGIYFGNRSSCTGRLGEGDGCKSVGRGKGGFFFPACFCGGWLGDVMGMVDCAVVGLSRVEGGGVVGIFIHTYIHNL